MSKFYISNVTCSRCRKGSYYTEEITRDPFSEHSLFQGLCISCIRVEWEDLRRENFQLRKTIEQLQNQLKRNKNL